MFELFSTLKGIIKQGLNHHLQGCLNFTVSMRNEVLPGPHKG